MKPGDKVQLIYCECYGIKIGDIRTVKNINGNGNFSIVEKIEEKDPLSKEEFPFSKACWKVIELFPDPKTEKVSHPGHYNKGIECWDFILSHRMNFLEGNILKYLVRYKDKNGLEDLRKARQYLDKLISEEEKKNI